MQRFLLLTFTLIFTLIFFELYANSAHPLLLKKIKNKEITVPYYIKNINQILKSGVNSTAILPDRSKPYGREKTPKVNFNALAILVHFSDKSSSVNASFFDNLMFGTGLGTVKDYYSEISYGNLDILALNLPSSIGWLSAPQTYNYYVNGQNGFGTYPQNAQKLTEDVVGLANPFVDFAQYDNNSDGYVDALFIIHAGPGAEYTGSSYDIWSHKWNTYTPQALDGVNVYAYSMEPEYWANPGDMTCGVYAHEMGHAVFGLPDLYDRDYSSEGLGDWSLMAGGSWNGTLGSSPAHPDAWSRYQMGYTTPTVIMTNQLGVTIPRVEDNANIFRLWTNGTIGQQYFLLENREAVGYDVALPNFGLCIYHVDESVSTQNDNELHYLVALEQADGLFHLENNINDGDNGDPFPGSSVNRTFDFNSTPNSRDYSNANTLVAVRNISNAGSNMTADFEVGVVLPILYINPTNIDLGTHPSGYNFSSSFIIRNDGGQTLSGNISKNASWISSLSPNSFSLTAGQQTTISFTGSFPTTPGSFNTNISVTSNADNQNVIVYGIVQDPSPILYVNPTNIDLGTHSAGYNFSSSFIIRNDGGQTLSGNISENASWISSLSPNSFSLTAGQQTTISFTGSFPTTPGSFNTNISVTSNAGNQDVSIYGIVRATVIVDIPDDLSGSLGQDVLIPINVIDDLTGLGVFSFQGSVQYDHNILQARSPYASSDGTISSGWGPSFGNSLNPGEITFGHFGTSELNGTGTIINLLFTVNPTASPGSICNITFNNFIFNSGNPSANTTPGVFTVQNLFTIAGLVNYAIPMTPLLNAVIDLTGGSTDQYITDATGIYEFNNLTGGLNYDVSASKTGDIGTFSIGMFDASLIARHVVGLITLTPDQLWAGDADSNGTLQMYDAACVATHVVGLPPLPDSKVGNWFFDPLNYHYPSLNGDMLNQDFKGCLCGDVDGNWPAAFLPKPASASFISDQQLLSGKEFRLPIVIEDQTDMYAAYFELEYPAELLVLDDVILAEDCADFQLVTNKEIDGIVKAGLYGTEAIHRAGNIAEIIFQVKGEEGSSGTFELNHLQINNQVPQQAVANFEISTSTELEITSYAIFQNYPNPFNPSTTIKYRLAHAEAQSTLLQIYNIKGQLIRTLLNQDQEGGEYMVTWDGCDDSGKQVSSGVYIYQLKSGSFVQNRKLLKMK